MATPVWSLTNRTIDNRGTKVNPKLTTVTPQNPQGWETLRTYTNGTTLQYKIDPQGRVGYRRGDNGDQYANLQQYADDLAVENSTKFIQNEINGTKRDLIGVLTTRTQNTIPSQPAPGTPAPGTPPGQTPGSADAGPSSEDLKTADPLSQFDPKLFGEKENFGSLKYPNSIESGQDRIIITQFQYKRSGVLQREGNFNNVLGEQNGDGTLKNVVGYVTLPMPNDISETNSVGWGEDSLSNIAAASMPSLTGLGLKISEGNFNLGDETTNLTNIIKSGAVGARAKQFLATKAAAGLIGKLGIQVNPEAYITRATGAAINPNLELLFNGPKLRQFGFQFKMTPRDKGEADQIRRIIRFFKQGMSPRKGSTDDVAFFLGTPNVFKIKFMSGNSELKSIGKIKTCALVAFSANYTPDGFYAAYQDGAAGGSQPVAVSIQLGFTELTPIFNDEYDKTYDDIGPNVLTNEEKNSLTVNINGQGQPSGPQGPQTPARTDIPGIGVVPGIGLGIVPPG